MDNEISQLSKDIIRDYCDLIDCDYESFIETLDINDYLLIRTQAIKELGCIAPTKTRKTIPSKPKQETKKIVVKEEPQPKIVREEPTLTQPITSIETIKKDEVISPTPLTSNELDEKALFDLLPD